MKFGQFMSHYKRKNFIKKFCKNCSLKTSSRPFCVCKELSTTTIGQWNFWTKLLLLDMYQQNYQICPNQHTDLLKFLFTEDYTFSVHPSICLSVCLSVCLSRTISQEPYIIWWWFLVNLCKMMISRGVFFIFSKFWFFLAVRGVKGQKIAQNEK